ncbi:MAG: PadR family transcriptional regulator [Rhodospirillaceae bacterium]|nr:PadR family transcriptional regulator [Rhodospirillaceae bacterium]
MDTRSICLGVLSMGEATGYEIKKLFEEGPFSHFYDAGYGSIYPALGKLLEAEQVTCRVEAQAGRPAKKVYAITDAGHEVLAGVLHEEPAIDHIRSEALVMMFFGHKLSADQRARVLDKYHGHYAKVLAGLHELDTSREGFGRQFVHGFGLAIYETAVRYLEEHGDEFLDGKTANDKIGAEQ